MGLTGLMELEELTALVGSTEMLRKTFDKRFRWDSVVLRRAAVARLGLCGELGSDSAHRRQSSYDRDSTGAMEVLLGWARNVA